jgi:D-aminoacyl-tRNA deacylase
LIALIQRVNQAQINISGQCHIKIKKGVLALIGIEKTDSGKVAEQLLKKILSYRVFNDARGKMNLSLRDVSGELMLVPQFTLVANTDSGLRPSFSSAMPPADAELIYSYLVNHARENYPFVQSGLFGADIQIQLENDGPVTFILNA